ncbi:hypothetical protein GS907_24650 [Rhodococcus hoagii]|nr:hypothetical protein [Prescottella equi]
MAYIDQYQDVYGQLAEDMIDPEFLNEMRGRFALIEEQARRDEEVYGYPKARVRVMNRDMEFVGLCGDYRVLKFTDKMNAAGALTMRLPATEDWIEAFVDVDIDAAIPIIVDLPGYQTLWFVTKFSEYTDETGAEWIDVTAINCWEYINRTVLWPSPGMPAEFQWPKEWIGIGPSISLLKFWFLLPNLARLQGLITLPDRSELLNLSAWNLLRNAQWPLMVRPSSIIHDTSKLTALGVRMDDAGAAFSDILKTEGLQLTFELYVHGESEQPFPDVMKLTRTTLIIDIVEKADLRAFTGTVVDGIIRTGVELLDDGLSWLAYPILGKDDYSDYFANVLGTLPMKPWIVFHKGTVTTAESITHKPMASRATVGGKSPNWVNKAAVAASNALLGMLGMAIGLPGLAIGIFEDEVKNVAMAFHTWEDIGRAKRAGPWRFREVFREASSGLSMNALAAVKSALWDTRGYVSHKITVTNGRPFYIGLHLTLGSPVGYEKRGTIHTDFLYSIEYEDSPGRRGKLAMEIGDGTQELEPGAIALSKIRRLGAFANSIALAS